MGTKKKSQFVNFRDGCIVNRACTPSTYCNLILHWNVGSSPKLIFRMRHPRHCAGHVFGYLERLILKNNLLWTRPATMDFPGSTKYPRPRFGVVCVVACCNFRVISVSDLAIFVFFFVSSVFLWWRSLRFLSASSSRELREKLIFAAWLAISFPST